MQVRKIREGLWRWTAAHPAWTPDADRPNGWAREVGCVYFETPAGVVLIDPLVPGDAAESERFWAALDRDVDRVGGAITVLVSCVDHGRSADAVRGRYAARGRTVAVAGDAAIRGKVACALTVTIGAFVLPPGIEALPIEGLSPGETAYALLPHRALVFADAVIGAEDGSVRVAPASWAPAGEQGREAYARAFRAGLRRLCDMHPDILLTSHGAPVTENGEAALREALGGPAWGD
jgi:glyoxylase-like metal-dependent hydrolase (beta-lactamase superfamily II)